MRIVAVLAVPVLAVLAACGTPCRAVQVKPLPLTCAGSAPSGEIHFDDAATFQTFLDGQCLPDSDVSARRAVVNGVDFTKNAVFVAVGQRAQTARCISDRQEDGVEVCDDGLRVGFADRITDTTPCGGSWTVAFIIDRADLRAALDTPVGQ